MIRRELENAGADWVVQDCSDITASGDAAHGLQVNLAL
jgi:hypothetical protein